MYRIAIGENTIECDSNAEVLELLELADTFNKRNTSRRANTRPSPGRRSKMRTERKPAKPANPGRKNKNYSSAQKKYWRAVAKIVKQEKVLPAEARKIYAKQVKLKVVA